MYVADNNMDNCSTLSLLREREFNHYRGNQLGIERLGFSWDMVRGFHRLPCHSSHDGCINSVTFSSDGRLMVSGSDDRTVKLWDMYDNLYTSAENALLLATVKTHHTQNIFCAAVCPFNNNCVVSCAADGTLRLNDLNRGGTYFGDDIPEGNSFSMPLHTQTAGNSSTAAGRSSRTSSAGSNSAVSADATLVESKETVLVRSRGIM